MLKAGGTCFVADVFANADPARPALLEGDRVVSYAELRGLMTARALELDLPRRSLVVLAGTSSVEYVVTYLALLGGGHVPLLAGSHVDRLASAWRPAAVIEATAGGVVVDHRPAPERRLHDDLALLLSTSGSTGAPKLVRLSAANIASNARAIAGYLGLGAADRAITSLPLHYCYGLSVLHSHLAVGASVVLTTASVVDPCFAAALRDHGVTNVAGVPHTFELLERADPDRLHTPALRFITQAGGRMAPDVVRRWLDRAASWGAAFYVMYGQTEATARMAYLPPDVARRAPGAIGLPIPGGVLELLPVDGHPEGIGELVYRGPNVMLGYAESDDDLARGATLSELRTGDLARHDDASGVFEIVGRRSRLVKPFGVRVDLDEVERALAGAGAEAVVAGDDTGVAVVAPRSRPATIRATVAELTGLPPARIGVDACSPIPRTATGKVDYDAVIQAAAPDQGGPGGARPVTVAAIYASVLGRHDVNPASTFLSLGGDSLNYVECSLRLEQVLGHVPTDWHVRTVGELESVAPTRRRSRLDTTVLLRAIGICLIVSTHMKLWWFPGGAHTLLAVVGYNASRFLLPISATTERVRAGLRTVARAAIPTMVWVAAVMALTERYSFGTLFLVNNYVGPRSHDRGLWHFWFIEVFVHILLITTVVLAVPAVRRLERRWQYAFPLAVFAALLVFRYGWVHFGVAGNLRFQTHGGAWFFALGWLVHRSDTWPKRVLTSALCVLTIPGFFGLPQREWLIAGFVVALVWLRDVPFPRVAVRPVGAIASASLWILITHFTVWPPLERTLGLAPGYVATIAAGVLTWAAIEQLPRMWRRGRLHVGDRQQRAGPEVAIA